MGGGWEAVGIGGLGMVILGGGALRGFLLELLPLFGGGSVLVGLGFLGQEI